MSGEESLAQSIANRKPQASQLKKAGRGHFVYSLVLYLFGFLLCRDDIRRRPPDFLENLIGGWRDLEGPLFARHITALLSWGHLILAGAVNTASWLEGVPQPRFRDGWLSAWFRQPHPWFGTSFRLIISSWHCSYHHHQSR